MLQKNCKKQSVWDIFGKEIRFLLISWREDIVIKNNFFKRFKGLLNTVWQITVKSGYQKKKSEEWQILMYGYSLLKITSSQAPVGAA
jgi:hypothetical protein